MGKKKEKTFEVTPVRMEVPLIPTTGKVDFRSPGGKVSVKRASSNPVSVAEAIETKEGLSRKYRKLFESGNYGAIYELLRHSPSFESEEWIQQGFRKLASLMYSGDFRLKPGRRRWEGVIDGLWLVSLVKALGSMGLSVHEALGLIRERLRGASLSYERLKRLYYGSLKDDRLKALLFSTGASATLTEKELSRKGIKA